MSLIPKPTRLQILAGKWLKGTISEAEQKEFNDWFTSGNEQPVEISDEFAPSEDGHKKKILDRIHQDIRSEGKNNVRKFPLYAIAAGLGIFIITGIYLHRNSNLIQEPKVSVNSHKIEDKIVPGSNKAVLTLADGTKINLTDAGNGELAQQAGIKITKSESGQLIYTVSSNKNADRSDFNSMNTIETPKGGQYLVNLPDGTTVWLNATSSISFPVAFSPEERKVRLTGEAYFEVAKDKSKPFKVEVRDVNIRVLGTHFNVMAYKEEGAVKTTLLEGSVRLDHENNTAVLKPGQQGYVSASSNFNISDVNVATVTAWKDGLFLFDNTNLRSLMGQISRWYDVEVVFEPGVKDDVFFGKIERSSDLTKVLKILELGGVHFKIDGRKLIVKP